MKKGVHVGSARMKAVSFVSFKGGAGKTTALCLATSGLILRGQKVALFESDENAPLTEWQYNAGQRNTWDAQTKVFPSGDLYTFEKSMGQAEKEGFDLCLIDTHGGGSELNSVIVLNSDLAIVPTAISSFDIDTALTTIKFAARLFADEEMETPVGLLITRLPHTLNRSRMADLDMISELPAFETRLRERDAYAGMKRDGMLHLTTEKFRKTPGKRISVTHFAKALDESLDLADDMISVLEG